MKPLKKTNKMPSPSRGRSSGRLVSHLPSFFRTDGRALTRHSGLDG
jgi:hypothetical protein